MRYLAVLAVAGLFSSVSFADTQSTPQPTPTYRPEIKYHCHFEGRNFDQDDFGRETECKVSGTINELYPTDRNKNQDPIEIRCSDGFRLESRDAAIALNNGDLFINAVEHEKLATIFVEDFLKSLYNHEIRREADLMYSRRNGKAKRLEGSCEFEKRESAPLN